MEISSSKSMFWGRTFDFYYLVPSCLGIPHGIFSLSSTMISRLIIIKRDEFRLDVLVLYELRFLLMMRDGWEVEVRNTTGHHQNEHSGR